MLRLLFTIFIFCISLISLSAENALSPEQALALEGKSATVEFAVRGVGRTASGAVELYSEDAWDKPNCFYLRLGEPIVQSLVKQNIPDPGSHYLGAIIRARGVVSSVTYEGIAGKRGVIELNDPAQLKIVKTAPGVPAESVPTVGSLLTNDNSQAPPAPFTPTDQYRRRELLGFTLLLNPELSQRQREVDTLLKELEKQFKNVQEVLTAEQFDVVRQPPIWIEWDNPALDSPSAFLGSEKWISLKGLNPEKLNCIEINNSRRFVLTAQRVQPWLMMHELAHVWHFRKLGVQHPGIMKAYADAMDAKLYDSVLYTEGVKKRRAYAAKNYIEYFAELSEAWFGKNDYYPFTRKELQSHDPQGYNLMLEIWGDNRKNK